MSDKEKCPICLLEKDEFELHHTIWRMDGGSDNEVNILPVCKTCHAIITFGDTEDRVPRDLSCVALKMFRHGVTYLDKASNDKNDFLDKMNDSLERFQKEEKCTRDVAEMTLKKIALAHYMKYMEEIGNKDESDYPRDVLEFILEDREKFGEHSWI